MNDNLATLGDILIAVHERTENLEKEIKRSNGRIEDLKDMINGIDQNKIPRENKTFYLLIATTVLTALGLIIALLIYSK